MYKSIWRLRVDGIGFLLYLRLHCHFLWDSHYTFLIPYVPFHWPIKANDSKFSIRIIGTLYLKNLEIVLPYGLSSSHSGGAPRGA